MKNVFIGLLVLAAGAGVYFFLLKKKEKETKTVLNKEWIIGKWKIDSLQLPPDDTLSDIETSMVSTDSNYKKYTYLFSGDKTIVKSLDSSVKADTNFYVWAKDSVLIWKKLSADSVGLQLSVIELTKDSMRLRSKDGADVFLVNRH